MVKKEQNLVCKNMNNNEKEKMKYTNMKKQHDHLKNKNAKLL